MATAVIYREKITNLKEWQAESFIYVLLYCCISINHSFGSKREWNLSKICCLYDLVGDIFGWAIVKKMEKRVSEINFIVPPFYDFNTKLQAEEKYKKFVDDHQDLRTNIRLLPKECFHELEEICAKILSKENSQSDKIIKEIILLEIR